MRGMFVTLEGPDGSGKSTIMELLNEYFLKEEVDFIRTREPGGTKIGEDIRKIILDNDNIKMCNETEALLYAASRAQHVNEKIRPALDEGKLVLCDRYILSSLAYQGVGRNLGIDEVKNINDFGTKDLYPDLVLFFHIDPEVTLKRKLKNFDGDRLELEGNEFHKNVYSGYMEVIKKYPKNLVIIDATQNIEDVFKATLKEIKKIIDIK